MPRVKTRKRKRQHHVCKQMCSDCRQIHLIPRKDLLHAARLRCPACGGPLNRISLA